MPGLLAAVTAFATVRPHPPQPTPPRPHRPGRRRSSTDPVQRARHLKVYELHERWGVPAKKLAAEYDVSDQTIYNWVNQAAGYPEVTGAAAP